MTEFANAVRTRVLHGFDDPQFGPREWDALLESTNEDNVYLTWQWQRAWWETKQRGRLLLITAEREGVVVALAPFYAESGMINFVCTDFESDYLDFIGDVSGPCVLHALLATARSAVPDFEGFQFYFMPDASRNGERLQKTAEELGLSCYAEEEMRAPVLDVWGHRDLALNAANRKRVIEREQFFRKNGVLEVETLRDGESVLRHLPDFFEQHISRHSSPGNPSRFVHDKTRLLFERFTRAATNNGWLRFMRIAWDRSPIAFHYGLCCRGRFFWGPSSFAPNMARYSPGQVLIRQLLLAAIDEGVKIFDFGTGDQDFKLRSSSHVNVVRTWGLYPRRLEREQPGGAAVEAGAKSEPR